MAPAQPEYEWRVSIRTPDGKVSTRHVVAPRTLVVGRDPGCDITLRSQHVSRRHARIDLADDGAWISDVSSSGTLVGNHLVSRATVEITGDAPIQIGPYQLRVTQVVLAAENVSGEIVSRDPEPVWGEPVAPRAARTTPGPEASRSARVATAPVAPQPSRTSPGPVAPQPSRTSPGPVAPQPARTSPGPVAPQPARTSPGLAEPQRAGDEPVENRGTAHVAVATRRAIHRELLDNLDLVKLERSRMNDHLLRAKVKVALEQIIKQFADQLPAGTDVAKLIDELGNEALGLGPLEQVLGDPAITEIMVVDPHTIYIEERGRLRLTDLHFTDEESAQAVLERIVTPLGRRIDESSPMIDARLKDGSRVNAIIRPLSLRGTCITIRKFAERPLTMDDLIGNQTLTARMATFLERSVRVRKNILVSGGTGSGKTTLLNVLSAAIPEQERIITIEDSAELQLVQPHVVSLEGRPANMEGRGQVTIRDLVKNAMRMRPDRIIVGEVRSGEALDMLQAMNTGHEGSMTTIHANNPREALKRAEVLALMAGVDLPTRAIREQMSLAIHLVVHQSRFSDGARRIVNISEVIGLDDHGEIEVREIFRFQRRATDAEGRIQGEFQTTGYLPSFLDEFISHNLVAPGEDYL